MALNNGKHIVEEIEGIRCSIVEKNITSEERLAFLTKLLKHNGYNILVREEPAIEGAAEKKYTIGVADILFNPVVDVYKRRLKSETGHKVTPAYWLQLSAKETEEEVNYWDFESVKK
jgi:hypothetical protein